MSRGGTHMGSCGVTQKHPPQQTVVKAHMSTHFVTWLISTGLLFGSMNTTCDAIRVKHPMSSQQD